MDTRTARVIEVRRTNFIVEELDCQYVATVRGAFHVEGDFPKVGDYVQFEKVTSDQVVITEILPRQSTVMRRAVETGDVQIIAANVDLICIVMGLDGDFNISRLERYLQLAAQSAIEALVILNKRDLASNEEQQVNEVEKVLGGGSPLRTVASTGEGVDTFKKILNEGKTVVLLGSSGAGKSTITNWLLGEERQAIQETREDDSRGRHTTTSRQLFAVPGGGYIIDTPGMRELGVVEEGEQNSLLFGKISVLADQCKFRNCDHDKSTGCAVLRAVSEGLLTQRELTQYLKLSNEISSQKENPNNKVRFQEQNKKRAEQKREADLRRRLSQR